ncbi:hypothetical protein [Catenovulum sediminis]|uniref:Uncharacterized protein n=1 Tax=Catenovulum sediminis TaxID=1740262 RepID=A0ABV1RC85_9ALTE|nr:hypothetical protein [Catenovulum sediminis]
MAKETSKQGASLCYKAETARLLSLSVAQIYLGLTDGDSSVDSLIQSFKALAECNQQLADKSSSQPAEKLTNVMAEHIDNAIVAFQFYDRLCQRLQHVSTGLSDLGDLLESRDKIDNPEHWALLREKIKQQYSIADEHQLFEQIMQGASVEEAIVDLNNAECKKSASTQQNPDDDITLF